MHAMILYSMIEVGESIIKIRIQFSEIQWTVRIRITPAIPPIMMYMVSAILIVTTVMMITIIILSN